MAFNLFNVAAGVVNEFTPHLRTAIVEKTNEIKTAVENAAACVHQEVGRTVQDKIFNVREDPNVVFVQEQAGVTLVKFLNDLENTYKSANEKYQIDEMRAKIDEFVKEHKLNDPNTAAEFCKQNPETCAKILGYIVLAIASGPLLTGVASMFGFTSSGVGAGTFASAWQSSIGLVAAGSIFATLQSMAATGAFTSIGYSLGIPAGMVGIAETYFHGQGKTNS